MKNKLVLFLAAALFLSFVGCSGSLEGHFQDVISSVSGNRSSENGAATDVEVDYSGYTRLLEETLREYGGHITEKTVAEDIYYNSAGLCYAHLIDLDQNGVLELITIAVKDEYNSINSGEAALDLYYGEDWELLSLVSVYTLSAENTAVLIDNFELSSHGNGGVRFGVEYSFDDSLTYLLESFRSESEEVKYYELQNATSLEQVALIESSYDYDSGSPEHAINGDVFDDTELFNNRLDELYGEAVLHPISWLTEEELAQLKARNEETYSFLEVNFTENENPNQLDIDYSPYSALIKAYTLDYNIENLSATDYRITGMTLDYTYPTTPEDSMLDASGFCYANLVDLDNNGVLELVLIAFGEQDWDNTQYAIYGDTVKVGLLENPNIVKVYTILPDAGIHFLGSLPVSYLTMPVSMNYGIKYIVSEDKTYIAHEDLYQFGNGTIYYYGLSDEYYFSPEEIIEIDVEGSATYEGAEYTYEEAQQLMESFGESKAHIIENMNDVYIEELEAINEATFDFLADYPIADFDDSSGAYNDGQFYYFEYAFHDLYPPEIAIKNYYNALTMRDYDTLASLGISNEDIDFMKTRYNPDDPRAYVPGYIVSDLEVVTTDTIENSALAADIDSYIAENMPDSDATIMYCRVNEILDPHKSMLGLQAAGGVYDTYFVIYSDDPDGMEWKIAEIFDTKFYPS